MTRIGLGAVVFLGPSCPVEDVRVALPGALIVPPVRRGDLYRYRLLNFGLFLVIDGVFADTLAVSPREVVDVLQDGATVVGTASMGALRAADCWPAGAVGRGTVYRLYRRGVLASEDEVAVLHLPDSPWPPVTQALVTIRVAARRARRAGHVALAEERAIVAAAEALEYGRRGWARVLRAAGVRPSAEAEAFLRASDAKRDDALHSCHWVAQGLACGRLMANPRRDPTAPLGRLGQERERGPDPCDGENWSALRHDFLGWLWCAGHHAGFGESPDMLRRLEEADVGLLKTGPVEPDPDSEPLLMRFIAFRRAVSAAKELRLAPDSRAEARATAEILNAHGGDDWDARLARLARYPRLRSLLAAYRRDRALCLQLRNAVLFPAPGTSPRTNLDWQREGTRNG